VQMGTAFLRCPEAGIHPAWVAEIARAAPEDTVLTRGFSGRLGRGLPNRVTETFAGDLAPAAYPVQRVLMAPVRAAAEAAGDLSRMQAWAGQGAAMARAEPADALVRRLWAEAEALLP
jgi:nitronate monooxygenase